MLRPEPAGAAGADESLTDNEELFMLIGELESDVAREKQRADEAVRRAAAQSDFAAQAHTIQQLSQQAGLIARAVMEADESRSELHTQQLAKQQLAEQLLDERKLRLRAEASAVELRAEVDAMRTEVEEELTAQRQLQQQLDCERAAHEQSYAVNAELTEAHVAARRRVEELGASHTQLASQLAVERTRHAQAKTEVETISASLQAQLATAQSANERLRELTDEHQRQTQQLARECAKLHAADEAHRAGHREDAKELEALRIELAEERAAHDATRLTLLSELGRVEEEMAAQQPQLERLTVEKARLKARVAALLQQHQSTATTSTAAADLASYTNFSFATPSKPSSSHHGVHTASPGTAAVFERLHRSGHQRSAGINSGGREGQRHLEHNLAVTSSGLSPTATTSSFTSDQSLLHQSEYIDKQHEPASSSEPVMSPSSVATSRATLLYKLRRIGGDQAVKKMSGATTAELAELLQSRKCVLLARLSLERPGKELMQALREAPIDELEVHGAIFDIRRERGKQLDIITDKNICDVAVFVYLQWQISIAGERSDRLVLAGKHLS